MKLQMHPFKIQSTEQIASFTSIREEMVQLCHSCQVVASLRPSRAGVTDLESMAAAPRRTSRFAAFPHGFRNSSPSCQSSWAGTTKVKRTRYPLRAVVREEQPTCAERTLAGVSPSICFIVLTERRSAVGSHPFFRQAFLNQSCVLQISINGLVMSKTNSHSLQCCSGREWPDQCPSRHILPSYNW